MTGKTEVIALSHKNFFEFALVRFMAGSAVSNRDGSMNKLAIRYFFIMTPEAQIRSRLFKLEFIG
jgi:hypothetical protein